MNRRHVCCVAALVGSALFLAACSRPAMPSAMRGTSDQNILAMVIIAHHGAIERSRLAEARAAVPDVKDFASRMVVEHSDLLKDTEAVARDLALVPNEPKAGQDLVRQHAEVMRNLQAASGAAFDRLYIDQAIDEHEQLVAFTDAATTWTERKAMIRWLDTQRSIAQDHLKRARLVRAALER